MKISLSIKCTKCGTKTNIKLQKVWGEDGFSIGENINGDDLEKIKPNDCFKIKQTSPDEMTLICKNCGHTISLMT